MMMLSFQCMNLNDDEVKKDGIFADTLTACSSTDYSEDDNSLLTKEEEEQQDQYQDHLRHVSLGPKHLEYECLDATLSIRFEDVRRSLCHSKSTFLSKALFQEVMKYSRIQIDSWDNHDDTIGAKPSINTHSNEIISTKKIQYQIPPSGMIKANMAYEELRLIEYNPHCFALYKITSNPDVPFGSCFTTHTLTVVTKNTDIDDDDGASNCHLSASSQVVFEGKAPLIAGKIRNSVRKGTCDFFEHMRTALCHHHNVSS